MSVQLRHQMRRVAELAVVGVMIVGAAIAGCDDDGGGEPDSDAMLDTSETPDTASDAPEPDGEDTSEPGDLTDGEDEGDVTPDLDVSVDMDVPAGMITLAGSVQKGPFVSGSSVAVSQLDASLQPTGQVFNTQTNNDLGEFSITLMPTGPVALEGRGFYYNEVTGDLSSANLTLRALYVPQMTGQQQAYINMITHLTVERVRALVASGTAFADAVAQAEAELREELDIAIDGFTQSVDAVNMNILGSDTDDNAYLLAVSSVLTQVAVNRGGSVDAKLQELLNTVSQDLADGTLDGSLAGEIDAALLGLRVDVVAYFLGQRLASIGSAATVPDMHRVLDQDRDGVGNLDDNCILDANADQGDGDSDGVGDACDACPATVCADDCIPASELSGENPQDVCYTSCEDLPWAPEAACGQAGATCFQFGRLEHHAVCGQACDPTLADPCGTGEACIFLTAAGPENGGTWACVSPDLEPYLYFTSIEQPTPNGWCFGVLGTGDAACPDAHRCTNQPGSFQVSQAEPLCARMCDPADPSVCGGEPCVAWGQPTDGGTAPLYACQPPTGGQGEHCVPDPGGGFGAGTCDAGLDCVETFELCPGKYFCCLEAGGAEQPCRFSQGGGSSTCDPGYICEHYNSDTACANGAQSCCKPAGGLGELCGENWACDAGLICVDEGVAGCSGQRVCCVSAGGDGEPCHDDNSCDTGFRCRNAADEPSCAPLSECCVPSGGDGELCNIDNSCDAGLSCVNVSNPNASPCGDSQCCVSTGGANEPCNSDATCEAGLSCVWSSNPMNSPCVADQCCRTTGADGEPCNIDNSCDTGLACVLQPNAFNSACGSDQCCTPSGSDGEPCNADGSCDAGLTCVVQSDPLTNACDASQCCQP